MTTIATILRGVAAATLMAAAGGCGADLSSSGLGTAVATSSTGASDTAPYGAASSGSGPARFDPFAPAGTTDTPLREVIANPSLAEVLKPGPLPELSLGRADAPVVLVKYMSLTCPHCRRFMADVFPTLKREYLDTGKVRLVIREFPIGKTSGTATIALRCVPMTKYLALYKTFLQQQAAWVSQEVRPEAIVKVAGEAGLTRPQLDACIADRALVDGLKQVKDRGRQLGIIGTPNFFVGNKLVKSTVGVAELRSLLDAALAAPRSASAKAG
jgi:protein-disulfide isomerase